MAIWVDGVIAFALTWSVIFLLLRGLLLGHVIDQPNARSLHTVPIPRTGGIGVMLGIIGVWVLIWSETLLPLAICVGVLMLLSFVDDVRGLSAGGRLLMHFLVATVFVGMTVLTPIGWMKVLTLIVALVWMTNLFNFMDGSDGLAGGMTLLGFSAYAAACWQAGDTQLTLACAAIIGAALAFLAYNFHPARIFMGDVGSIPLGFLSAALGVLGWQRGHWPIWFPLLVFSPFVVDATATLIRRLLRGEKVWQAHREHFYQRLVQCGWGHRKTALWEYALMTVAAASALWLKEQPWGLQGVGLALWALLYLVLAWRLERRFRQQ